MTAPTPDKDEPTAEKLIVWSKFLAMAARGRGAHVTAKRHRAIAAILEAQAREIEDLNGELLSRGERDD